MARTTPRTRPAVTIMDRPVRRLEQSQLSCIRPHSIAVLGVAPPAAGLALDVDVWTVRARTNSGALQQRRRRGRVGVTRFSQLHVPLTDPPTGTASVSWFPQVAQLVVRLFLPPPVGNGTGTDMRLAGAPSRRHRGLLIPAGLRSSRDRRVVACSVRLPAGVVRSGPPSVTSSASALARDGERGQRVGGNEH
jgi:hypothetical protein